MSVILTRDVFIILENLRENYFISGFIPSGRGSRYGNRIFSKKWDEQEAVLGLWRQSHLPRMGVGRWTQGRIAAGLLGDKTSPSPCAPLFICIMPSPWAIPWPGNSQLRGLLSKSDSSHWPEQFLNQKFPPIKLLFQMCSATSKDGIQTLSFFLPKLAACVLLWLMYTIGFIQEQGLSSFGLH